MQKRLGHLRVRFIDHAKAGATLQETRSMKNIRPALLFSFAFTFALATAWVTPPLQAQVAPPRPASNIVVQHDVPHEDARRTYSLR